MLPLLLKILAELAAHVGDFAKRQLIRLFFAHPSDVAFGIYDYRPGPLKVAYYDIYLQRSQRRQHPAKVLQFRVAFKALDGIQ
jgi:hypothetical protein